MKRRHPESPGPQPKQVRFKLTHTQQQFENSRPAREITSRIFDRVLKRQKEREALINATHSAHDPNRHARAIASVNREMTHRNRVRQLKTSNHDWLEEVRLARSHIPPGVSRHMTNFSQNQTHHISGTRYTYGKITELMYAAYWGNVQLVETMTRAGANVNARDRDGRTAVMYASMQKDNVTTNKRREIIVYLCRHHGADANAQDKFGITALMRASEAGNLPIVLTLEICGARPDIQDKQGKTALMYAAIHGKNHVIRSGSLMMYGKHVTEMKDSYGRTAAQYAEKFGHHNTVQVLKLFR